MAYAQVTYINHFVLIMTQKKLSWGQESFQVLHVSSGR